MGISSSCRLPALSSAALETVHRMDAYKLYMRIRQFKPMEAGLPPDSDSTKRLRQKSAPGPTSRKTYLEVLKKAIQKMGFTTLEVWYQLAF